MSNTIVFTKYLDDELMGAVIAGGVGIMPTDTMYGIVASAYNKNAVERIYSIKRRQGKPGTIIASSAEQLIDIGIAKKDIEKAMVYWPGPVSVVLPIKSENNWLHQGYNTVAVRIVADSELIKFLNVVGPLVTSSANITSEKPITNTKDAMSMFNNELDYYVDKGILDQPIASTIITFDDNGKVKILRNGVVKIIQ